MYILYVHKLASSILNYSVSTACGFGAMPLSVVYTFTCTMYLYMYSTDHKQLNARSRVDHECASRMRECYYSIALYAGACVCVWLLFVEHPRVYSVRLRGFFECSRVNIKLLVICTVHVHVHCLCERLVVHTKCMCYVCVIMTYMYCVTSCTCICRQCSHMRVSLSPWRLSPLH